jgi:hypothetical protein
VSALFTLVFLAIYDAMSLEYNQKVVATITSWKFLYADKHQKRYYLLEYRYTYQGKQYNTNLIDMGVRAPRVGNKMEVYVSPQDPTKSQLSFSDKKMTRTILLVWSICTLLLAVAYLWLRS